jgi:hypothetical protein
MVVMLIDDEGHAFEVNGLASLSDTITPRLVPGVDRFVDASAGNGQVALLSDTGRLFMWGTTS